MGKQFKKPLGTEGCPREALDQAAWCKQLRALAVLQLQRVPQGSRDMMGEAWREPWPKPEPQTFQFSAPHHEPASTEELGGFHPHVTTASDLFLMCALLRRETNLHKMLSGTVVFKGKRQETDTKLCAPHLYRSSLAIQSNAAPEKAASTSAPRGQPN